MEFKNENAFKRWLKKYFFDGYRVWYTETRCNIGFPDILAIAPNFKPIFAEIKYEKTRLYTLGMHYTIPYRPMQLETLRDISQARDVNVVCIIGFADCFVVAKVTEKHLRKQDILAILEYSPDSKALYNESILAV